MLTKRLSQQAPHLPSLSAGADWDRLRGFSLLSFLLHAAILALIMVRTGERLRYQSPVRVITVDLSQLKPPPPVLPPKEAKALSKTVPVRRPLPAPAVRSMTAALPVTPEQPLPTAAKPAAVAATVTVRASVAQEVPAGLPTWPVAATPAGRSGRSGSTAPAISPGPATQVPIRPPNRTADDAPARAGYLQRCRALIEHYKEYPLMARKGMIEGTVVIRGTLARDGSLRQCGIVRASGSALLDNAALRAVRSVRQFPSFPQEVPGDEQVFELPVSFRMSAD